MRRVLAVDQSTSGTKATLIDEAGAIVARKSLPHRQFYPAPGCVEHDAQEIWQNTLRLMNEVGMDGVCAIALTNQRETTVFWERGTGKPLGPAVVWQDVRAQSLCQTLAPNAHYVQKTTGLALSPYYSAAKAMHVLQNGNLPKNLCIGTVDSYLLYRLTGGKVFATDVSNAGRTQLMNLKTLDWDAGLLDVFGIRRGMLAEAILPSDSVFGYTNCEGTPSGIPICAMLGDSHASLFGHGCHQPGSVKASYGTGSSIMMNVGDAPVFSKNGLSACVGFGFQGKINYVLEGNVTCSADTLVWLKDGLGLIDDIEGVEALAASVPDAGGVCLVPAFSGLGAPYFDSNARAVLCGMSRGTTRAHVVRAALDAIAQQNADVLDAMARDVGSGVGFLSADGGGSVNDLLMQTQADLVPCHVRTAAQKDLTALGAGIMAAMTAGLIETFPGCRVRREYVPRLPQNERLERRGAWAQAVTKAR